MIRGVYNSAKGEVEFVDENESKKAFENLAKLLGRAIKMFAADAVDQGRKDLLDENKLTMAVTDLMSLILKAPLLLPALRVGKTQNTGNQVSLNNFETLVNYVLSRHLLGKVPPSDLECVITEGKRNGSSSWCSVVRKRNILLNILSEFQDDIYMIYENLMRVPADTRPGNNVSSLASHLSLTSIAQWVVYGDSKDYSVGRMAALFHDIGKLVSVGRHWEASNEFFDALIKEVDEPSEDNDDEGLNDIIKEVKKVLDSVKKRVEEHHRVFIQGDFISSKEGRESGEELKEIYGEKAECKPFMETLEMTAAEAEDYINEKEKSDAKLREKYSECSKYVYQKKKERTQKDSKDSQSEPKVKATLNMFNFPGVQSFITSFSDLRDLSAASMLVDMAVTTIPFIVIDYLYGDKTFLPLDALLVSSGGHSFIATREDASGVSKQRIEEELKKVQLLKDLDVRITVSSTPLIIANGSEKFLDYRQVIGNLFKEDGKAGLRLDPSLFNMISPGMHLVCESCGLYPATKTDERGKNLCCRCYTVHELSKSKGFYAKVNTAYKMAYPGRDTLVSLEPKLENEDGKEKLNPMEYLAGNVLQGEREDPTEPIPRERRYISVVKSDGNDAGEYFSHSVTFGEYIDKSFKVDYWVKRSFVSAADEMVRDRKLNPGMVLRTLVGMQYIGGDDILLIGPAATSPILVLNALEKASQRLGMSFKVGVVTMKYDDPIQFAIETAERLMEHGKIKKDEVAADSLPEERNSMSFIYTSSLITPSSLEGIINSWKDENEKNSIYMIKFPFSKVKEFLDSAGKELNYIIAHPSPDKGEDKQEKLLEYEKNLDKFKDNVRSLEDIMETFYRKRNFHYTVVQIMRESVRHKEMRRLADLLLKDYGSAQRSQGTPPGNSGFSAPIADVFYLSKAIIAEAGERVEKSKGNSFSATSQASSSNQPHSQVM